jgi:hypothetical protein
MTGLTKERKLRVLDSVGAPGSPTPSELAKWLRSLPPDIAAGDIASVLELSRDNKRFVGATNRIPKSQSATSASSRGSIDPAKYSSAQKRRDYIFPYNPGEDEYRDNYEDVPVVVPKDDLGELKDDRNKVSIRQAAILERLSIDNNRPESFWAGLSLIGKLCYEQEQAPVLSEAILRYPHAADTVFFRFSGIESKVYAFKKEYKNGEWVIPSSTERFDKYQTSMFDDPPLGWSSHQGKQASPLPYQGFDNSQNPSFGDPLSEWTHSPVGTKVPTGLPEHSPPDTTSLGKPPNEEPDGTFGTNEARAPIPISSDGACSLEPNTIGPGRIILSCRRMLIPMVEEAIELIAESKRLCVFEAVQPSGQLFSTEKYNPLPGHKVVSDLVFEHDRDRVLSMLEKPKHSRVRQLERIIRTPVNERGPWQVTDIGNFSYLLYKKVEIVSLWVGDKPSDQTKKVKTKKQPGKNKARKQTWIQNHRIHCTVSCGHCSRF